jgi:hypothetical protein
MIKHLKFQKSEMVVNLTTAYISAPNYLFNKLLKFGHRTSNYILYVQIHVVYREDMWLLI